MPCSQLLRYSEGYRASIAELFEHDAARERVKASARASPKSSFEHFYSPTHKLVLVPTSYHS